VLQHVVENRFQKIDRHEHVALYRLTVERLLHQQRADTKQSAVVTDQCSAAPLRMRRRGKERFV